MSILRVETGEEPAENTRSERDAELMARLRAGDRDALSEVLELYWNPVVAYAESILHSRDAAQDVAQDAFIRLWDTRSRWTATSSLRPFVFRIARNLALNARRSARRRVSRVLGAASAAMGRVRTPAEELEASEFQEIVKEALNRLPPKRREAFWLARYHDFSHREIGEIMSIAPQTVANHITVAAAELRVLLKPLVE